VVIFSTQKHPTDVLIETRWINQDSAGLINERLDQATLRNLLGWFLDDNGGRGGYQLLEQAPIFDTLLEQRALSFFEDGTPNLCRECTIQFENGLVYGTILLSDQEDGSPFPAEMDFHAALEVTEAYQMASDSSSGECDVRQPGEHLDELCGIDSRIPLLVRTCYRMVEGLFPNGPVSPQAMRFLFFAGLLAAGLSIPSRELQAESQDQDLLLTKGP